ncbi:MAG: nitroreductase family protein [Bifidobacteriaceae bacterium]|jgi:SagB-type dehydrogenase family enzyme|nr:nitroreductase family protein [Bifidobacteriaceae bacterium]
MLTPLGEEWTELAPGQAARRYAEMIFRRAEQGMPIRKWRIDWADAPWPQKFYPGTQLVALPRATAPGGLASGGPVAIDRALGDLLFYSYGLMGRRSRVNCNESASMLVNAEEARWARGASSGGGRYCAGVYLVVGRDFGLESGIYHYSPVHHALELLSSGDWTGPVAHAQRYPAAQQCYVILTVKYWQSAFKYNDFACQATSMDLGTLTGTWRYVLGDAADLIQPDLWVDEASLAGILDLDSDAEAACAVMGIGPVTTAAVAPRPSRHLPHADERSQRVHSFVTQRALQRDALAERGVPSGLDPVWPVPESLTASLRPDLAVKGRISDVWHRETSFGRFDGAPVRLEALIECLAEADAAQSVVDRTFSGATGRGVGLYVIAEAVDGLPRGCYRFDADTRALSRVHDRDAMAILLRRYFLNNYDLERAAALVVMTADPIGLGEAYGVRGYRAINTAVGAVCQHLHLACARRGVGAGTALGFDAASEFDALGLSSWDAIPVLTMFVGHDRPASGALDLSLECGGER